MPGAGELQPRVLQRMHVGGYGYVVVETPAPFALAIQKVVDQALDNLAKRPGGSGDGILECFVPLGPGVLLPHRLGTLQQRPAGIQGLGNGGTQFAGERRNRLFDVDVSTVHLFGSEQLWKSLENIFTDHRARLPCWFTASVVRRFRAGQSARARRFKRGTCAVP